MKVYFLILVALSLLGVSAFGESIISLKSVDNFDLRCIGASFSYDTIWIKKNSKTLTVELRSGYKQAVISNPNFLREGMEGRVIATIPVEGCSVSATNNAIITCLEQTGDVDLALSNRRPNNLRQYSGQANVTFQSAILEHTSIGHGEEVTTTISRQGRHANLRIFNKANNFKENLQLIVACNDTWDWW